MDKTGGELGEEEGGEEKRAEEQKKGRGKTRLRSELSKPLLPILYLRSADSNSF